MMSFERTARRLSIAVILGVAATTPSIAGDPLRVDGGQIADVTPNVSGVRFLKGIPFAAPPVGDLRWKAPEPVKPWDGVRKAEDWGPRCMQSARLGNIDPNNKRMDEDCLYLNVWTPAKSANDKLPVMVWIHGGSNRNGSGSEPLYDGANLAAKGVVVVTVNYRLDVFGFLAHPDLTKESGTNSSGSYGLLDQIEALKWVQKNISTFGGDPKEVTLFGESAGSFDISLLIVSPLAKGLFARAIGESGGALTPVPPLGPKPLLLAEAEGLKFAQALGASSIGELRGKPASEVLQAAIKTSNVYLGVVEGYVVPEHPAKAYADGKQNDVPLLVGWNADEGTLFAARIPWGPGTPSHADRIRAQFKDDADVALKLYPPGSTPEEDKRAFDMFYGDQIIDYGAWAWAELASKSGKSPVYRYHFTRRPPGAPELSLLPLTAPGVFHSAELYYVWNNLQVRDWPWETDDKRLADTMSSYWINFAKTGNPNANGFPRWPAYEGGGGGEVMELGKEIGARAEAHRDRYEFLDGFYRKAAVR